jgi:hypothetical protein
MSEEGELRAAVARQRVMSQDTWWTLQKHGVTENTRLRLDFLYFADNESKAQALVQHLNSETDYHVSVEPAARPVGLFFKRGRWVVRGTTKETAVSLEILIDWVTWMVVAGFKAGCEFDGWGARAPG